MSQLFLLAYRRSVIDVQVLKEAKRTSNGLGPLLSPEVLNSSVTKL